MAKRKGRKSTARILRDFFGYVPTRKPDDEFIAFQQQNQEVDLDYQHLDITKNLSEKAEAFREWIRKLFQK